MSDDAPKSAFELAMERLRLKDKEAGLKERALTDAQRAAIVEAPSGRYVKGRAHQARPRHGHRGRGGGRGRYR